MDDALICLRYAERLLDGHRGYSELTGNPRGLLHLAAGVESIALIACRAMAIQLGLLGELRGFYSG